MFFSFFFGGGGIFFRSWLLGFSAHRENMPSRVQAVSELFPSLVMWLREFWAHLGSVLERCPKPPHLSRNSRNHILPKATLKALLTVTSSTPNINLLQANPKSTQSQPPKPAQQQPGCHPFASPKSTLNHPKTRSHEQPNPQLT